MVIIDLTLTIILLFFPTVFLMIFFIKKYKETSEKIKVYEKLFGVVFTKEVLEDMKDIPPESYNYNPAVFVPEYDVIDDNTKNAEFSELLITEETEESEGVTE